MKQDPLIKQKKYSHKTILSALIVTACALLVWYYFAPLFGLAIGLSIATFAMIMATLVIFCVGIILIPILTGMALILSGFFIIAWVLSAVIFFPIAFPVLIPILVLLAFLKILRR